MDLTSNDETPTVMEHGGSVMDDNSGPVDTESVNIEEGSNVYSIEIKADIGVECQNRDQTVIDQDADRTTELQSSSSSRKSEKTDVVLQAGESSDNLEKETVLELEDDDLKSKLLSIPVLPRIPKRKPGTNDDNLTSVGETSSSCGVLERVNSVPSVHSTTQSNFTAAGWTRSNPDRLPPKSWMERNRKTSKLHSNATTHSCKSSDDKLTYKQKQHVEPVNSAWPPLSASSYDYSYDDSYPMSGPLPTLSFEEQMRARAKFRKRQMNEDVSSSEEDSGTNSPMSEQQKNNEADSDSDFEVDQEPRQQSSDSCTPSTSNMKKVSPEISATSNLATIPLSWRKDVSNHPSSELPHKSGVSSPLPYTLPVLPLFASICPSTNDKTASPFTKSSVRTPVNSKSSANRNKSEQSSSARRAGNSSTRSQMTSVVKYKYTDKRTLQQCVNDEMKTILKPYYGRRQISKEQYKDIMRRVVRGICHISPYPGVIKSTYIEMCAEKLLGKALKRNVPQKPVAPGVPSTSRHKVSSSSSFTLPALPLLNMSKRQQTVKPLPKN